VVAAVLDRLEKDTCNDVQTVCVKALSVLVTRANDASVQEITSRLVGHVLGGRPELRDVYGIGLKTLVERVPAGQGGLVCEHAFKPLVTGIEAADAGVSGGQGQGGSAAQQSGLGRWPGCAPR
jgi:hypothetical protein